MAVTTITFDPRVDLPSGTPGPQPVTIKATPTRIREIGTQTVYPETVTFSDVTADTALHLQSTDGTWAWTIGVYRRLKILDIRTVFVTGATANWVDLVDVDPDTFLPLDPYTTVGQALAALKAEIETGLAGVASLAAVDTHISTAITALIGGAPGTLDTLKEISDAIGADPAFISTIATGLAGKEPVGLSTATRAALTAAYATKDQLGAIASQDNGNGTITITATGSATAVDNGNGTITLAA